MNQSQPPTDAKPTYAEKTDRLKTWIQFLKTLAPFIWLIVILIVIIPLVGQIFIANAFSPKSVTSNTEKTTVVIPATPDWNQVDLAMVTALQNARQSAKNYAEKELDVWVGELSDRIDNSFLDWYFGYFNQKQIEYKTLFVQLSSGLAHLVNPNNPTPQEKIAEIITSDFQQEFAKRVLIPQIAQLKLERITQETVKSYLNELSANINSVPVNYQIPQADWQRYLNEIAITINDTEGNISNLSLKMLAAGSGYLAVKPLVAPLVLKIGSKIVPKLIGKAGAKVATKTGAALVGKVASAVLDCAVGVGIIAWDIWDNYHTAKVEKPILRANLLDYLQEVKASLLENPENGIMVSIAQIQTKILQSI